MNAKSKYLADCAKIAAGRAADCRALIEKNPQWDGHAKAIERACAMEADLIAKLIGQLRHGPYKGRDPYLEATARRDRFGDCRPEPPK